MAKKPDHPPLKPARRAPRAEKVVPDQSGLPTREQILTFIAEHPGQAGKREIARSFGVSGGARIALKRMLKELGEEGLVRKDRKRLTRAGELPSVSVLSIVDRDADGEFVALPANWTDERSGPPRILITSGRGRPLIPAPGIGDRVLARVEPEADESAGFAYKARILKVLEKKAPSLLGVLRTALDGTRRIEPVDRKQSEYTVAEEDLGGAHDGDLVAIEVKRVTRYGLSPAKVVEVVGAVHSEKAISLIAIHAHDIPHVFPEAVIEAADAARPAPLGGTREDWRTMPLVTIDPADAKDHDDAVFAEPDTDPENPGGFLVTVAIADVAWYVRPGSPLDREAMKRGNSVYFPDRVVPMLPERISNDLCSLREGEDRPAIAVRMQISADGKKKFHWFHRIMMRSAAKLSYQQAQAAIDGKPDDKTGPLVEPVLKPLWAAYALMKRARDQREPLDLELPERKVIVGADGAIERIVVPERLDAHRLIEEFMIQANVAAAETLERKKSPLVYRVHDAPSLAKLEALRQFLASIEMNLPRSGNLRPGHFNLILDKVRNSEHAALVNEVVLRSQSQAVYSPENIGHFGLNLRRYAHFTSPIRRYADLIVHRALVGSLHLGPGGITPEEEAQLEDIAAEISTFERRAMAAERETVDRLIAHHLADRINQEFVARISGVTKAGLFVTLPDYGADGFIPISTLGRDYYIYDEAHQALSGEKSGLGYRLGDDVDVRLVEAVPLAGALRFEMLSEGRKMPTATRSFHKASRGRNRNARKPGTRPPRR